MAAGILQRIRAERERTLAEAIRRCPEDALRAKVEAEVPRRVPNAFVRALTAGAPPRLIAEIKRASPSAGPLRPDLDPAEVARAYAAAGASAVSVLTEPSFFGGSLEDLRAVRGAVTLPVLRKDFILHRYQLLEAVAAGADAALLIVAMLSEDELRALHAHAMELHLDCLVEVHNEAELDVALRLGLDVVGINNRDLDTMRTDIETTLRLLPRVPEGVAVVSESGIRTRADIQRLAAAGVHAVLVGETLMRSPDPGAAAAALLGN